MDKNDVGLIMGSQSDWQTMKETAEILKELKISFETKIISAHRTPDRLFSYASDAFSKGFKVIIAGAGGAAHLPGMVASKTIIPVIGVPTKTSSLSGLDSLYSIVQMPRGYSTDIYLYPKSVLRWYRHKSGRSHFFKKKSTFFTPPTGESEIFYSVQIGFFFTYGKCKFTRIIIHPT